MWGQRSRYLVKLILKRALKPKKQTFCLEEYMECLLETPAQPPSHSIKLKIEEIKNF